MAIIITVHGTFASGPPEGRKWWQRGSTFAADIGQLVTGERTAARIEPHIWDGLNSERSRRAAGEALYRSLAAHDAAGEPVCLIGHSHGGSVIAAALMESARHKNPLTRVGRWVTVGTPFIKTERQPYFFLRLGLLGKAAYLAVILFSLLGALGLLGAHATVSGADWLVAIACFFGPLIVYRGGMAWFERRRSHLYNRRTADFAAQTHRPRWLSLWQADDEAVQGLRSVKSLSFDVFPRGFAVGPLSMLALILFPFLCVALLQSETAMQAIGAKVFAVAPGGAADELFSANGKDIRQNALVMILAAAVLPASLVFQKDVFTDTTPLMVIALFASAAVLFMIAAILVTLLMTAAAHLMSALLARILNPTTRAQIRSKAYGSDTIEDRAVDAGEWPMWLGGGFPPLPDPLSTNLRKTSDAAIGQRLSKFRDAVRALSAVASQQERSDMLSEYLTWEELIHTGYFADPLFRKLVAYAVSQCDGFKPTPKLIADPDYPLVARIYADLVAQQAMM